MESPSHSVQKPLCCDCFILCWVDQINKHLLLLLSSSSSSALSYCYIIIIMCSLYLLCSVNFIATASPFVELFTDEASLWLSYKILCWADIMLLVIWSVVVALVVARCQTDDFVLIAV